MAQMKTMSKTEIVTVLQEIWEECYRKEEWNKCDAISYAQGHIKGTWK